MEWTRKKQYRKIEDAEPGELEALRESVAACPWRQQFHIQPETGLLNDPNGFSFYNGMYHLFYQWFPLGPVHGMKYWYHVVSKDLVHWENVGIGIEPTEYFETHGVYSGSALVHDKQLYLLYTGNTRQENWVRRPYQCMAVMNEKGIVKKFQNPVISEVPNGYTDHFRDPKIWRQNDHFYVVIGAQRQNQTGCVVLYRSENLLKWSLLGEVETTLTGFGYMWECPDYFELNGKGVLIFSPQGLQAQGDCCQNIFQSGYIVGDPLNLENRVFKHGDFVELDRGFDFYAPQTMLDPHGRRILIGWMGLPDIAYPSDKNGWAHCLTLPRVLTLKGEKVIQQPLPELHTLRKKKNDINQLIDDQIMTKDGFEGISYEMICEFDNVDAEEFGLYLRAGEAEKTVIKYDATQQKVILDRSESGEPLSLEYGTVRKCKLEDYKLKLHIFVDVSSIEVFINDGEEVFTSRIFPKRESRQIKFFARKGKTAVKAVKWDF